ncbi:MAG: leucine-rich repeat domain-containing protein [Lachnospiraceae bacterium]|nr:leucine-rich repeat domain-containing protein [Lachnospiraceae bacterium]
MKKSLALSVFILLLTACAQSGSGTAAPTPGADGRIAAGAAQQTEDELAVSTPTPTPTPTPAASPTPTPIPAVSEEGVLVGDIRIPLDAAEADISGIDVSDIDMDEVLDNLPELKRLTMIDCGLDNDGYAALQDAHPDVRLIWEIVLSHWTLRTDVVAFSSFKVTSDDFFMHNDEAYYLKYCTDLVALDLGHNFVSDLSFLQYMPKLQILILVDNVKEWDMPDGPRHTITDLSMLQYVPKLKYLEFFANNIQDFTFLQYLPDLEDLNCSYTGLRSIEYLRDKPHLERLWIEHTHVPWDQVAELQALYPNCTIVREGEGSIDQGWRSGPHYNAMRAMFRDNYVDPHYAE